MLYSSKSPIESGSVSSPQMKRSLQDTRPMQGPKFIDQGKAALLEMRKEGVSLKRARWNRRGYAVWPGSKILRYVNPCGSLIP